MSSLAPIQHQMLYGHKDAVQQLKKSYDKNRLHHAIILAGLNGIGKETLAWQLIRYALLYPEQKPSQDDFKIPETSKVYAQIEAGSHPHVFVIQPVYDEKKQRFKRDITLDALDGLTNFMRLAPTSDAPRFILINPADGMNKNTQNALLKILEEPPANTHFLLLTSQIGMILPTIRSRCLAIQLDGLQEDDFNLAVNKLMPAIEDYKIHPNYILSQGAIGQALQNEEIGLFESYGELCRAILTWVEDSDSQNAMRLAEDLGRPGQENISERLVETLLARLAQFLKNRLTQTSTEAIIPEEERVLEFWARLPENKILGLYDQVLALWQAGDTGYLDRKLTFLQIIGLLSNQSL